MAGTITKEGRFELFRSPSGQEVLSLEGEEFALVEGPKGEEMIARQGNFARERVLERGEFKFVEFAENGEPREDPHLFLKRNNHYQEIIFPEGMPTVQGEPRHYIQTKDEIGIDEVETYVQSVRQGSGREVMDSKERIPEISHHLSQMRFPAEKEDILQYVQRRQGSENVIEKLGMLEDRNFHSIEDVVAEIKNREHLEDLALGRYEEQSSEDVLEMIEAMEPAELRELEEVEKRHRDRKEVLEAIEHRLRDQ